MNNFATHILLEQLQAVHGALEQTMDGVTDEVAQFMPPQKANPIAGTYAHLVFSEDFFVQGILQGKKPVFETDFKGKTGASEIQPIEWETAYPKWLKEVTVDIKAFREYAKAVYTASETYVSSLTDAELEKDVDMSAYGMGKKKVYYVIGNMLSAHANSVMGEISLLKGIQGLKGYPF